MDKLRLLEVLDESTCLISKGESTRRRLPQIFSLLWGVLIAAGDPSLPHLEQVDCQFVSVGVDREQAEKHRSEFLGFLAAYPFQAELSSGFTYKHLSSVVGDDVTALRVLGLGQTLGLWSVLLPGQMGVSEELAEEAASLGLITFTGYQGHSSSELQTAVVA